MTLIRIIVRTIGAVIRTLLLMVLLFYCAVFLGMLVVSAIGSVGGESEVWVPGFRQILNSRNIPDLSMFSNFSGRFAFRESDILCLGIPNLLIFIPIFLGELKRPWSLLRELGILK